MVQLDHSEVIATEVKLRMTNIKEILYLEVPTPQTSEVCSWLHHNFQTEMGEKIITPDGFRLQFSPSTHPTEYHELSTFVWSVQRTTYLKVFRVGQPPKTQEQTFLKRLETEIRIAFPHQYPEPPEIDLSQQSIFEALEKDYPLTVKYFKKMPNGEYDLKRVYWWEKRWREGVRNPQTPQQVIFKTSASPESKSPEYDLIYIGGVLGVIHAAVMARLGYKVLLIERLPFGRMNREWNISRSELKSLTDLGLFTETEVESFIAREYKDGFHKFFDAYNPDIAKAQILHTPRVLNINLNVEILLKLSGEKLKEAGGEIWDETEFLKADINPNLVNIQSLHLPTQTQRTATARLFVDAMGTASPIAWQLNGGRAFDSVCPTVGAVIEGGFEPGVWDATYGDVLNTHGDISRGRQLIWELFPGAGNDLTFYLFHYHQVNAKNPGSLLEMYEDFFTILPEYRRCDLDQLVWKKPTFGYIPGHFSSGSRDRKVGFDRLILIGDAASLQSPLVFTGFGSLVRNLSRLTDLLNTALKHDLLTENWLDKIRAYQTNISVTWLFSKGMMVPTGKYLPPAKINSILNTFFGILATEPQDIAETFIKDRTTWWLFTRLALKAARTNPLLLVWILDFVTFQEVGRWLNNFIQFMLLSFLSFLFGWLPHITRKIQPWLEPRYPKLWMGLLTTSYALTDGIGKPQNPPLITAL